jgi:hypothetical protein
MVVDRTGSMTSDGFFGSAANNACVHVGDGTTDMAVKGFVSVDLNSVPAGANVTSAVLRISALSEFGNPFGDFVTLTVDHVNVVAAIDATAFDGQLIDNDIVPFPALPADGTQETRELDITAELKVDLAAGRPISSFRFEFNQAPTRDGQSDVVCLVGILSEPFTSPPVAIVTFEP